MSNSLAILLSHEPDVMAFIESGIEDIEQSEHMKVLVHRRANLLRTLAELVNRLARNKTESQCAIQTLQDMSEELHQLIQEWNEH